MAGKRSQDFVARQQAIVAEAARAFAAEGCAAVSLDRVSVGLGMSHRYMKTYFLTKAALVGAVLDRHLDRLLEALAAAEAAAPPARLDALAAAYLDHTQDEGAEGQRVLLEVLHGPAGGLRADLLARRRWVAALFADALAEAVPGFQARPELAMPLAQCLLAMLDAAPAAGPAEPALPPPALARHAVACIREGARHELAAGPAGGAG